ncbi:MAG: ABC transporter permease [Prolixibacteraceae bacterium]|nr:ABC transporter permease [Prolixibacteraceae bacterium]
MLRIIFISAFRSLLKYKHMSVINLIGLIAGLTSFLFAVHYILFEFSYDSFFQKSENVYRVNLEVEKEGQSIYHGAKTPRALFFAMKREIPEIEANGLAYFEKCLVSYQDRNIANQDILWVSEDFEKVFPLEMIEGIGDYSRPRTGVISATCAKALYGNENPIGKIMGVNQGMPIEITGVFKDLPPNTHLQAQYFVSVKTWVEMGAINAEGDWRWNGWWNYIRLKDGSSPELTTTKINSFIQSYMGFLAEDKRDAKYSLQPLKKLHFIQGIEGEMGAITNYSSLINLIVIAVITLFIAWINYVNLSVAHAQSRSVQIRTRKLIGASDFHLWHQSLAESSILNIAALVISFLLYFILQNSVASVFNIPVNQAHIPIGYVILISVLTVSGGIFFSGMYHGIELTRIKILPDQKHVGGGKLKSGLVVVQMALSIIFLIGTLVVYKQISFMKNKDLGVALNDVVVLTGPASLNADGNKRKRYEGFRSDLQSQTSVEGVTFNQFVPGQEPGFGFREFNNPMQGKSPDNQILENNAGRGFIKTYGLKLLAGNDFSENEAQNLNRVILNESSMKLLGFGSPEEAVGKEIFRKENITTPLKIEGVVADFHHEGLHKAIYPIIWNNRFPSEFGYFSVRINTQNLQETLSRLQTTWTRHYPKDNFDFALADEQFNRQYESDSRFSKLYVWLTLLSIGIATIGLYGLILFYLEKRKKEISLRKVNGANIGQIIHLINLTFIKWVVIAFVIAIPVAWYVVNRWLENFAYKTDLSWWIFALAGLLTLGIALLTVSWQSFKAASKNPVEVLRYE